MLRALSALSILSLLALAPACDSGETNTGDAFRSSTLDVDIELSQADGGEDDGTILWEIVEAEVYEGAASEAKLNLFIENNTIFTPDGEPTCTIRSPYLEGNVREVTSTTGNEILFTVWDDYVFDGAVDITSATLGDVQKLHGEQILFEFHGNEIYLGEVRDEFRLLKANAALENSSDGRKLLIAALITGECGSAGIPGYTF